MKIFRFKFSFECLFLFSAVCFIFSVLWWQSNGEGEGRREGLSRVVIPAHVLVPLFAGDRFLASNLETFRIAATGLDSGVADEDYVIRGLRVVSDLNPCHEDSYYLANALLTWGGAIEQGQEILLRASKCRLRDELPPFFYGFNKYFFERDIESASSYLELAAERATDNAAGLRKFAIMLKAEQIKDEGLALQYLQAERDQSQDSKLKEMLNKRVQRLEGLVLLRDSQRRYEEQTGKALTAPEQLLQAGFLSAYPEDPLRLGYEFVDGRFMLKKLKVAGVEDY